MAVFELTDQELVKTGEKETPFANGVVFVDATRIVLSGNLGILVFDTDEGRFSGHVAHVPSCRGADFRRATGLSHEIRAALRNAGATTSR